MKEIPYKIIEPISNDDLDLYYHLRWKVLREPWGQLKGSEKDESDTKGINRMVLDLNENPVGVGMIIINSSKQAQIRFMGVKEKMRGKNVGTLLISCLEMIACENKCTEIILHSRENAVKFYERNGFLIVKKTYLLFGQIQHFLMHKKI